jgi:hypothetical protein
LARSNFINAIRFDIYFSSPLAFPPAGGKASSQILSKEFMSEKNKYQNKNCKPI